MLSKERPLDHCNRPGGFRGKQMTLYTFIIDGRRGYNANVIHLCINSPRIYTLVHSLMDDLKSKLRKEQKMLMSCVMPQLLFYEFT